MPGGSFAFADEPADEAVIDQDTGTITGGQNNTAYNISYTTDGSQLCSTTTLLQVTSLSVDDSSFELMATCDGATATVTGVPGGIFAFADAPADGAVIDPIQVPLQVVIMEVSIRLITRLMDHVQQLQLKR